MAGKMGMAASISFYEELLAEEAALGFKSIGADFKDVALARGHGMSFTSNGIYFFLASGSAYNTSR